MKKILIAIIVFLSVATFMALSTVDYYNARQADTTIFLTFEEEK